MKLLGKVVDALEAADIAYALIGAAAMAVHGVARSTLDLDLLVVDPRCLDTSQWSQFVREGIEVTVRPGDHDDPLAGVVRFEEADARPVDLVLGRHAWQRRILERSGRVRVGSRDIPTALPSDLVLLKLYAAGSQDAWDVHQLLAGDGRAELIARVEANIADLPAASIDLWRRILADLR